MNKQGFFKKIGLKTAVFAFIPMLAGLAILPRQVEQNTLADAAGICGIAEPGSPYWQQNCAGGNFNNSNYYQQTPYYNSAQYSYPTTSVGYNPACTTVEVGSVYWQRNCAGNAQASNNNYYPTNYNQSPSVNSYYAQNSNYNPACYTVEVGSVFWQNNCQGFQNNLNYISPGNYYTAPQNNYQPTSNGYNGACTTVEVGSVYWQRNCTGYNQNGNSSYPTYPNNHYTSYPSYNYPSNNQYPVYSSFQPYNRVSGQIWQQGRLTPTSGQCMYSATISWSTQYASMGYVYVQNPDNGSRQLFASGMSGSQSAPWIQAGKSYHFTLYDSNQTYLGDTWVSTGGYGCNSNYYPYNY